LKFVMTGTFHLHCRFIWCHCWCPLLWCHN